MILNFWKHWMKKPMHNEKPIIKCLNFKWLISKKLIGLLLIISTTQIIFADSRASISYRYQALSKLLNNYKRSFTVMQLWAGDGALSCMIAQNYNAVCI